MEEQPYCPECNSLCKFSFQSDFDEIDFFQCTNCEAVFSSFDIDWREQIEN